MITATTEGIYSTVYRHLTKLYKHLYFGVNQTLTEQDKAIISFQSYQEMIYMAQKDYIKDYYKRIMKGTV